MLLKIKITKFVHHKLDLATQKLFIDLVVNRKTLLATYLHVPLVTRFDFVQRVHVHEEAVDPRHLRHGRKLGFVGSEVGLERDVVEVPLFGASIRTVLRKIFNQINFLTFQFLTVCIESSLIKIK